MSYEPPVPWSRYTEIQPRFVWERVVGLPLLQQQLQLTTGYRQNQCFPRCMSWLFGVTATGRCRVVDGPSCAIWLGDFETKPKGKCNNRYCLKSLMNGFGCDQYIPKWTTIYLYSGFSKINTQSKIFADEYIGVMCLREKCLQLTQLLWCKCSTITPL